MATNACGIPVLVRDCGRVSDKEILKRAEALMNQGVAGIVYGRNVIQHNNPATFTRALMAVIHENASADDPVKHLEGRETAACQGQAGRHAVTDNTLNNYAFDGIQNTDTFANT